MHGAQKKEGWVARPRGGRVSSTSAQARSHAFALAFVWCSARAADKMRARHAHFIEEGLLVKNNKSKKGLRPGTW